tara:strand:+ start:90 stop:449 length:360 start_codon:yes stop_codon:yes gene_type:complete
MKLNDLNDIMKKSFGERHINIKSNYKEMKKPIFEKIEIPTANRCRQNGILTNTMLQSYKIEELNILHNKIKIQLNKNDINFIKLSEFFKKIDLLTLQIVSLNSNFEIEADRTPKTFKTT